jgi:hypothetical protein
VKRRHISLRASAAVAVAAALGVVLCAGSSSASGNAPAHVVFGKIVNGATKCFTITLTDGSGAPANGYVSLTLIESGGKHHTQAVSYGISTDGTYNLCYGNGSLPSDSDITAFADTNGNGTQDAGEPGLNVGPQ